MEKILTAIVGGLVVAAGVVLLMLVLGALLAFPVMWIWNWMMPELFALPVINFWQAFWGTFMCNILFKGHSTSTKK
jgi:hypothetical protein